MPSLRELAKQKLAEQKAEVKSEKPTTVKKTVVEEKPKKPKKLTDRDMDKTQLLDEIYSVGKESKDKITISKLRATLEDFKLYSKRK